MSKEVLKQAARAARDLDAGQIDRLITYLGLVRDEKVEAAKAAEKAGKVDDELARIEAL